MNSAILTRTSLWWSFFVSVFASVGAGVLVADHPTALYALAGIISVAGLGVALAGHLETAAIWWLALEGIAYPFVRYPLRHNLVTLDRIVLLGFAVALLFSTPPVLTPAARRLLKLFVLFVALYGARAFVTKQLPTPPGYHPFTRFQLEANWLDQAAFPLIALLVAVRVATRENWLRFTRAFTILGVTVAIIGLAEWKLGFELATLSHYSVFNDTYAGVIRVSGPYGDPTAYGGVLVVCLAATIYWVRRTGSLLFGSSAIAIEMAGLAPAYTKTIWIAGIATLILSLGLHRRFSTRTVVVGGYVAFLVGAIYLFARHSPVVAQRVTGSTVNFWARLGDYQQGLLIFRKWPLAGAGFDQFINAQQFVSPVYVHGTQAALSAHNPLVSVLAETGLIGFAPLLLLIWASTVVVRRCRREAVSDEERLFAVSLIAVTVGVVLLSMTLLATAYPPILTLYAIFLGAAARRLADHRGEHTHTRAI